MMAKKLTALSVENAQPKHVAGAPVRTEIPDSGCPGLFLVVQPSGAKSWAVRYRFNRKPRKLTLDGGGAVMTLAAARAAAAGALYQIAQGDDPAAAKQTARIKVVEQETLRAQDSVEKLVGEFIRLHGPKIRSNTLAQYESVVRRFIVPAWRSRTVHDIRKRDIIALIEPIAVEHPYMADRLLGVIHKFFAWLVARDVVATNPASGVEMPGTEVARERFLDDVEIVQLWAACEGDLIFGAAIRVMLLVGARRSEVAEMRWSEIDTAARIWTLPATRSKNRRAHTVPLCTLAWEIINAVPRIAGCDFVFSTTGEGPIANFHHIKDRLDAKLNFAEPWVIHDLRRSCASGLQRLGVRVEVIEAALGHLSGSFRGIVGTYQRHDFADEKRVALQRWADHIEQLVTGKPAKILALRR
jgi:integrase